MQCQYIETPLNVFFDEIQYLKDWEVHLKSLVDSFPAIRFVVSGSAAAALRLKSRKSGAGRFTEFLLPPLTFAEYLNFTKQEASLIENADELEPKCADIDGLNAAFVDYLNIGGYPEAVFSAAIRQESGRFIKSDIIDKVLLRDLPQLYGIRDIQELNRLFTTLAYNTGNEVTLEELARWPAGEIDIVRLDPESQKPNWATEVKWSDRPARDSRQLRHLSSFRAKNPTLKECQVTTRTIHAKGKLPDDSPVYLVPTSLAVYLVGKNLPKFRNQPHHPENLV